MKLKSLPLAAKAAALALTAPLWVAGAHAATVTISCGSVGQDYENCKTMTAQWAKKTGHEVKIFTIPNSTTVPGSGVGTVNSAEST